MKKRFHWWFIPLGLVALLIIAVGCLVFYMHAMLPWENMLAATSNFKMELSQGQKDFIQKRPRDYSTLPDALVNEDGSPITTTEEFEARRGEILALFEKNVYGVLPKDGFETFFTVEEEGEALNGEAIRKQIRITVTTDKGSSDALMLLYIPKFDAPAPVVVGLNSNGNHAALNDPAILPSLAFDTSDGTWEETRGDKAERWNIENSIARGYAVATVYCEDFAPDSAKTYQSRVVGLFDEPGFMAVGAWAFGLQRCVDYLVTDPALDAEHIAVVGHSRLGKAAVWAGANDTRIGLVLSNDSGNSGASLSRGNRGETVKSINTAFPHWFVGKYTNYGDWENDLPVDQNLLLACIAPRQVYVASAEDDLWADPQGAWNSLMHARNAFEMYGLEVLPESDTQPPVNTSVTSQSMGYHVRTGWHDMTAVDWGFYLDYMDAWFVK